MRLNYDGFVDDILSVQEEQQQQEERTNEQRRIKMPMGHRVFHVAKKLCFIIGTFRRPISLLWKHMDGYRGFVLELSLSPYIQRDE